MTDQTTQILYMGLSFMYFVLAIVGWGAIPTGLLWAYYKTFGKDLEDFVQFQVGLGIGVVILYILLTGLIFLIGVQLVVLPYLAFLGLLVSVGMYFAEFVKGIRERKFFKVFFNAFGTLILGLLAVAIAIMYVRGVG